MRISWDKRHSMFCSRITFVFNLYIIANKFKYITRLFALSCTFTSSTIIIIGNGINLMVSCPMDHWMCWSRTKSSNGNAFPSRQHRGHFKWMFRSYIHYIYGWLVSVGGCNAVAKLRIVIVWQIALCFQSFSGLLSSVTLASFDWY